MLSTKAFTHYGALYVPEDGYVFDGTSPAPVSGKAATPNSFNSNLLLYFIMPKKGAVIVSFLDLEGRLWKSLLQENWRQGTLNSLEYGSRLFNEINRALQG